MIASKVLLLMVPPKKKMKNKDTTNI